MSSYGIVAPRIPPDFSGAGRRIMNQAEYLAREGYPISILTFTHAGSNHGNLVIRPLLRFIRLPERPKLLALFYPLIFMELLLHINKKRYKCIHCVYGGSIWLTTMTVLACRLKGVGVSVGSTQDEMDDPVTVRNRFLGRFRFWVLGLCNSTVSISPLLLEKHIATGFAREKCLMIPNSLDTNVFSPAEDGLKAELRQKRGIGEKELVITTVGGVNRRKGTLETCRIVHELSVRTGVKAILLVIGPIMHCEFDRNYYEELLGFIKGNRLEDRFLLLGEKNDVHEWLKLSDIFIFNSSSEGFGTALVEAQACGLPVFARKIPKVTEFIISHGVNGFVYENEGEALELLEQWVAKKCGHDPARITGAARANALERFSHERIMKQYIELFGRIS